MVCALLMVLSVAASRRPPATAPAPWARLAREREQPREAPLTRDTICGLASQIGECGRACCDATRARAERA